MHRLHSSIFLNFLKFEKTISMELVLQIDALVARQLMWPINSEI
jgi:hypothetical protein